MSKIWLCFSFLMFLSIVGCHKNDGNENSRKRVEEIRLGRELTPSEIIRNPLGEQGLDTSKVSKIAFEETIISFGSINEGEIVEKIYRFTNTGRYPLYILDVYGTCGCTVPEWPENMIEPGRGGLIKVKFNFTFFRMLNITILSHEKNRIFSTHCVLLLNDLFYIL